MRLTPCLTTLLGASAALATPMASKGDDQSLRCARPKPGLFAIFNKHTPGPKLDDCRRAIDEDFKHGLVYGKGAQAAFESCTVEVAEVLAGDGTAEGEELARDAMHAVDVILEGCISGRGAFNVGPMTFEVGLPWKKPSSLLDLLKNEAGTKEKEGDQPKSAPK